MAFCLLQFFVQRNKDLVLLKQQTRLLLAKLGLSVLEQTKVNTAVLEGARLLIQYAQGCRIRFMIDGNAFQSLEINYALQGRPGDEFRNFLENNRELLTSLGCLVDKVDLLSAQGGGLTLIKGLSPEQILAREQLQKIVEENKEECVSDPYLEVQMQNQELLLTLTELVEQQRGLQRLTRQLAEREERYRKLIENVRDGIFIIQDGCCKLVNRAVSKLLGMDREEDALGRDVLEFVHPDDRAMYRTNYERRLQGKASPESYHLRLLDVRGEEHWVEVRPVAVTWEKQPAVLVIMQDLTGKKKEMAMAALKNRALEAAANAIMITDVQGCIQWVNPAFSALTGYREEEVLGQNPRILKSGEHPEDFYVNLWETILAGKIWQGEIVNRRKNGQFYTEEMTITPVLGDRGQVTNFIVIKQDVSKRREAEKKLLQSKEELEDLNLQLQKSYKLAGDLAHSAVEANRIKSKFLANMSHELRTPLNGILGMASMLKTTGLSSVQEKYLDIIQSSGQVLLDLINDILEFSRLEADKVQIVEQDFDLYALVEQIMDVLGLRAKEGGVSLKYRIDPQVPTWIRTDPSRLRQVLINLLGNSLKFTARGEVQLQVLWRGQRKNKIDLEFAVLDTGIGIALEDQQKLFSPFVQVDGSLSREFGGTGLGLAISKELVQLLGGKLQVTSKLGEGSKFWFVLAVEGADKTVRDEECVLDGPVLLLAPSKTGEDLYAQLTAWGCPVDRAESFPEVIGLLEGARQKGTSYALLLVDGSLPDKDILELVEALRSRQEWQDLPLVLLLPFGQDIDRELRLAGIRFSLHLPLGKKHFQECVLELKRGTKREAQPDFTGSLKGVKGRILVAEDNPSNQLVIQTMLKHLGCEVNTVGNGQEAIQALENGKYDLVLMDCQMPVLDGFAATDRIRDPDSAVKDHDIPVIALTAHALHGDRERCLAQGMDDYLAKPVLPEDVARVLRRWLGSRSGHAERQARGTGRGPSAVEGGAEQGAVVSHLPGKDGEKKLQDFDKAELLQRVGGDRTVASDLLSTFWRDLPGYVQGIRSGLKKKDCQEVAFHSHALKGAAGNCSLKELEHLLQQLEQKARSGELVTAVSLFEKVENVLQGLKKSCLLQRTNLKSNK